MTDEHEPTPTDLYESLLNLVVREYRNGPPAWRVMLPGVWPGVPGNPETYAPGRWDANGEHWCFDRREDAVAAVEKAAVAMAEHDAGKPLT